VRRFQSSRWEIREPDHPDQQGIISLYQQRLAHFGTMMWLYLGLKQKRQIINQTLFWHA